MQKTANPLVLGGGFVSALAVGAAILVTFAVAFVLLAAAHVAVIAFDSMFLTHFAQGLPIAWGRLLAAFESVFGR